MNGELVTSTLHDWRGSFISGSIVLDAKVAWAGIEARVASTRIGVHHLGSENVAVATARHDAAERCRMTLSTFARLSDCSWRANRGKPIPRVYQRSIAVVPFRLAQVIGCRCSSTATTLRCNDSLLPLSIDSASPAIDSVLPPIARRLGVGWAEE